MRAVGWTIDSIYGWTTRRGAKEEMAWGPVELCCVLQLLLLLSGGCWAYSVVEGVPGSLGAEEARHYTVDVNGLLVGEPNPLPLSPFLPPTPPSPSVALLTEEGDADLYASTVAEKPDYRDSQYGSCSCGLDLVVIPTSNGAEGGAHQKVYLSVVGHSRHEVSQYKLYIIAPTKDDITKYQVCIITR